MKKFGPAILLSILLHVGLFLLALISLKMTPPDDLASSVPVTMVTEVPSHEMAAAPVDELAVKTPEPIPAPPEPVKTPPPPTPTPQPVPEVTKAQKTPDAKKPVPTDKNGVKKPDPKKQPVPDPLAGILANTPTKSTTKRPAQANTHPTQGASNSGAAPADTGKTANLARAELGRRIMSLWNPNCDGGGDQVVLNIRIWPSHGGRILRAPQWDKPTSDPIAEAAFARARSAIAQVDIADLTFPDGDYGNGIPLRFDARKACNG